MLRGVLGVIVGYVVMAILVFVLLGALWMVLGAERAFRVGTTDVTVLWMVASAILSLLAAIAGGLTCALIAGGRGAVRVLAALVLVLGLIQAIMVLQAEPQQVADPAALAMFEAMMAARQPVATLVLNPLIGAVGVLVGGGLVRRGRRTPAAA
jgi:hypothetical protein